MTDEIDIGGEFEPDEELADEPDGGGLGLDEDSDDEGADVEGLAAERAVELEQMLVQPGTYFNPQTEVVVIVDDSTSLDQEIFNMEAYEGSDWVRVSEESAVDEDERDRLLEEFQTHYHAGNGGSLSETALEQDDGESDEGETGQDPGRED